MSEERKKKSDHYIDGLMLDQMLDQILYPPKTPDRDLDGLLMDELTPWEIGELADTFIKVEEMGIAEMRRSQELGRRTEELDRIIEAIDQYFSLFNDGGRLSSTMALVQYLMKFRLSTKERQTQDTWGKGST